MAWLLLAWLVLEKISPTTLKYTHIALLCDNTPTVAWTVRLSTSKSTITGHLLHALALHQQTQRSLPLLSTSIAGSNNQMADIASRSHRLPQLTNSNKPFCHIFTSLFPLPKPYSWKEYQLQEKWSSCVVSCLHGKPLIMALWVKIPGQDTNTGLTGSNTQEASTKPSSLTTS